MKNIKRATGDDRKLSLEEKQKFKRKELSAMRFALMDAGPPPCAKCHLYRYCHVRFVACTDYARYIRDEKVPFGPAYKRRPTQAVRIACERMDAAEEAEIEDPLYEFEKEIFDE